MRRLSTSFPERPWIRSLAGLVLLATASALRADCPRVLPAPTGSVGFGVTTSFPGDLNGDGFPDIAVGATLAGAEGNTVPGSVYIYFQGPGADETPDVVLTGAVIGDRFGFALGDAGDLNGDGAHDLLVGAFGSDAPGVDGGRVYVHFGGAGFDALPDLVLSGPATGDWFGYSAAGVGDVNGDGWDDLLVAAPRSDIFGTNRGACFVYFGGPSLDTYYDLLVNVVTGNYYGARTVARAGDVNGDGYSDFLVGNSLWGYGSVGHVFAYWGGPGLDGNPDLDLSSDQPAARFGTALAG